MEDQLVTSETAILAKDKGFKELCLFCYKNNKLISPYLENGSSSDVDFRVDLEDLLENYNIYNNSYSAPTQSLLTRYLREVHKIDLIPTFSEFSRTYGYKIYYTENGKTLCSNHRFIKTETFELAIEAGLQEILKEYIN